MWRTGANEATRFETETDLVVGGVEVPKGVYSLYTLPSPRQWKLIINKETGQSGTQYDRTLDLARINLTKHKVKELVEKFTISLEAKLGDSGTLTLIWEHTELSVGFWVKKEPKGNSD